MKTHGKKTVEVETFFFLGRAYCTPSGSLHDCIGPYARLHTMSTCGIVNRPSDHNSVLSKGCQALKISTQIDLKSILPFSRSTCIIHFVSMCLRAYWQDWSKEDNQLCAGLQVAGSPMGLYKHGVIICDKCYAVH
ncbi:hypothetical protein SELMODRAFT_411407 [Selaginella moellendorffii]|uniref:Uncharacterized protein n=1 Tax=Selaginella moellendorffii TaxID=88036 RepID=D8RHU0_SELML|nr:hypothetical protein SELMODRAFT_432098 [Selaginella moellendorffii]EFJ04775.1 hypothetical protein SELMODRAFT_432096 [Selaginella moellendorffii]EFJ06101.1 hypothetical protein SELMODRAFT_430991 [Selaginella moellendorffii]EFJ06842.1 hypothetical protein SELMODRAFT_430329 [Selaginella moellendorffii]EFJ28128.1 hypothetical protein SELMODRAFT_411407 [Selaginella moellendorffii]